ncbi:MAG: translocase [Microbacteriaceae bacterium]|nr:translocase [Microbacteriaceae bacterium]
MGFGGLTFDKIFLVLVIALVILGPDKLPGYAQKLGQFVRSAKRMADGAKDRLRDEMGPEFDDVDWKQLDPRQYDPRRIIRDALVEDEREARAEERKEKAAAAAQARRARLAGASEGDNVEIVRSGTQTFCFDEEAT